ncbi:MAG: isoprenylcysteine carboxyl methyltransferase family protein [Stellaceae bacterium]
MSAVTLVVALVAAQRVAELVHGRRNEAALKRRGGVEIGQRHYPLFALLHAAWLASLLLLVPAATPISWPFLALFLILQALRLWIMISLGPYWTTRVITLPHERLVRRGPYRFLRHPNYAVVAAEIAALPLVFGAWRIALIFSLLNAALLAWRIRLEERALAPRRGLA